MNFNDLKALWLSDLKRYSTDTSLKSFVKRYLVSPGFRYSFYFRLCNFFYKKKLNKGFNPFYLFSKITLVRLRYKYGIDIPPETNIGSSLYIGHFGGIFINANCVIGKNFNISQGVTIGYKDGCPTIGDNVYFAPGSKTFGPIKIGNNVAIGANCVVTKDVPDNGVVVGIPGKVISLEGNYRGERKSLML